MGRWGGFMIAAILVIIGSIAGVAGVIEGLVHTTTTSFALHLAHFPEVVIQALLFGYLLFGGSGRLEGEASNMRYSRRDYFDLI